MENLDNLVVSFLDLEANKSLFKQELANMIGVLPSDIIDIKLVSDYDGIIHQKLVVNVNNILTLDDLKKVPFEYIDEYGNLIFKVGDVIL